MQVNIEIVRAFVRLRQMLHGNAELSTKLAMLEKKYDGRFRLVFDAIRELMTPAVPPRRRIGFEKDDGTQSSQELESATCKIRLHYGAHTASSSFPLMRTCETSVIPRANRSASQVGRFAFRTISR